MFDLRWINKKYPTFITSTEEDPELGGTADADTMSDNPEIVINENEEEDVNEEEGGQEEAEEDDDDEVFQANG